MGVLARNGANMPKEKVAHWRASKAIQVRARELRCAMTPAERKLWQHLRYGQLGVQFRKQHAVGPYIVDFFCAQAKLVVEVDGDSHGDPQQAEYDAKRTEWLNEQKHYRVAWFWNSDVLDNIEVVLAGIEGMVSEALLNGSASQLVNQ